MLFSRRSKKMSKLSEQITLQMLSSFLEGGQFEDKGKIIELVKKHLKLEDYTNRENFEISAQVLERLQLRHSILKNMEQVERTYDASLKYIPRVKQVIVENGGEKSAGPPTSPPSAADQPPPPEGPPGEPREVRAGSGPAVFDAFKFDVDSERSNRVYRLAATDLFVEKAISYLEKDAAGYIFKGSSLFVLALVFLLSGIVASSYPMFIDKTKSSFGSIYSMTLIGHDVVSVHSDSWIILADKFTKAFTFYGFIVLFSVICIRLGKALLDQAERLRERRHSLRQGRLYIHLSNGEVTIEELEKAFDWNVSKGNAFGNIPTEASAPWGSVIKEAIKAIPDIFKKAKGSMKD